MSHTPDHIEVKVNCGGNGLPEITPEMYLRARMASNTETEYFDNLEAIQREGLKRYFIASCADCEVKMPFEDQDKRNDWAARHSKKRSFNHDLAGRVVEVPKHVVKVYDEWVPE